MRILRLFGQDIRFIAILLGALAVAPVPGMAQGPADYIVVFDENVIPAVRAQAVAAAGASLRFNYSIVSGAAVTVPNDNALAALQGNPAVAAVIPDRPVFALQSAGQKPDNPGKGGGGNGGGAAPQEIPSGVVRVGVPTATSDGSGARVAILDTGIDGGHSDLPAIAGAFDAYGGTCGDVFGHGTHVAGIIAAQDNDQDVLGVAPGVDLYCGKVLDDTGTGSDSSVIAGLEWALASDVDVVNMSLGRPASPDDSLLEAAVDTLYQAGIIVVVSAGNDPGVETTGMVPAGFAQVFSVASTTAVNGSNDGCRFFGGRIEADTASYFTTDGGEVTISAPGEDREDIRKSCHIRGTGILSTAAGGGTTRMSGTSMAAPHVSGVVARMVQGMATPPQTGQDVELVRTSLQGGADQIGLAPKHSPTGTYTYDGIREGVAQAP